MQNAKHVVIVAGEESGDMHAAKFVRQLSIENPTIRFSGIGGQHMREAGVDIVNDLARFGVTGITEVIRNIRVLNHVFQDIKAHLAATKPDLLVLVDCPGFNLRLAKFAKKSLGLKVVYYISPQIWAWKANRIHLIRECVDWMGVIFPFEKKIYEQGCVPVSFVGHPLVEEVEKRCKNAPSRQDLGLPLDKRIIAMLPGSRLHEIERHMPVLVESARRMCRKYPDLHIAIPVASTIDHQLLASYFNNTTIPHTLITGLAVETINLSNCVVVASGTASLEAALLEKPMCIIYKGAWLSYMAAMKFIKVKYLGLCNLLQNQMIAPEILQYDCNPDELTRMLESLLIDEEFSGRMVRRLKQLKSSLSSQEADCSIASIINQMLN